MTTAHTDSTRFNKKNIREICGLRLRIQQKIFVKIRAFRGSLFLTTNQHKFSRIYFYLGHCG